MSLGQDRDTTDGAADIGRRALMLGAAAFAASSTIPDAAFSAMDARTMTPMRLRVVDWLALVASDRKAFLLGFSVGWNHNTDDDGAELGTKSNKDLSLLDLQLSRLANEPTTASSHLVTALVRATLLGRLPHLLVDGEAWDNLEMRHRVLVLQALVAGAHSRAVWHELGKPQDTETLSRGIARASRLVRSPYPVNPNVMLTRLLDYYKEDESQETTLAEAVRLVSNVRPGNADRR
jgi:hypothetical protein